LPQRASRSTSARTGGGADPADITLARASAIAAGSGRSVTQCVWQAPQSAQAYSTSTASGVHSMDPRSTDAMSMAQACGVSVSRRVTCPTGQTCRHIQQ
jgi:hypothetical protein